MPTYYPEIQPREELSIKTKDGKHDLYVAKYGNPNGIPVIMLHGGPGSGSTPKFPRYFDPEKYNIIVYDQRGGGKSTPPASLDGNNSQNLVEDLKQIQDALGIGKAVIWGGSWGSTLALLYAKAHPDRVSALILRGIFQGRFEDGIAFIKEDGEACEAVKKNPEEWRKLKSYIFAENEIDKIHTPEEIVAALYEKIKGDDYEEVARAFSIWEKVNSYIDLDERKKALEEAKTSLSAKTMGRIEIYYLFYEFFIKDTPLFENLDMLKDIPIWIVQGKYDDVCPPYQAEALVELLKKIGNLKVTLKMTEAGHSATDPGNVSALVESGQEYEKMYSAPKLGSTTLVRSFDRTGASEEVVVEPGEKLESDLRKK